MAAPTSRPTLIVRFAIGYARRSASSTSQAGRVWGAAKSGRGSSRSFVTKKRVEPAAMTSPTLIGTPPWVAATPFTTTIVLAEYGLSIVDPSGAALMVKWRAARSALITRQVACAPLPTSSSPGVTSTEVVPLSRNGISCCPLFVRHVSAMIDIAHNANVNDRYFQKLIGMEVYHASGSALAHRRELAPAIAGEIYRM